MTPIEKVLSRLDDVTETRGGWKALCPAHDDHKPSLSIKLGDDGRVLIYCRAGCKTHSVIEAVGLKMRDLFERKGLDANGRLRAPR